MTINSSVLEAMLQAGCSAEQIVCVAKAVEEAERERSAHKRELARLRQQKRRLNKAMSRDVTHVTHVTRDKCDIPLDKEGFPRTPSEEINPPKEKAPKGAQKKSPKTVLQSVLSEAIAAAVVEHRAKIKKPLTERAAELLAKRLASAKDACGLTPDQAADLMIEKGWLSFEAEWGRNAMQAGWSPEPVAAEKPKPDSELSPEELTAKWTKRMSYARDNRCWFSSVWGPMPGDAGCRVPEQFLQDGDGFDKHGYRWDDQSRRAA